VTDNTLILCTLLHGWVCMYPVLITVDASCASLKIMHLICHVWLSQYEYFGIDITIVIFISIYQYIGLSCTSLPYSAFHYL